MVKILTIQLMMTLEYEKNLLYFFVQKKTLMFFFQYLGCMDEIFNKLKNKKHNACMACVVHNAMKLNQTNKLTWLG